MNKLFRRHQESEQNRSNAFIKRLEESKRLDLQEESEREASEATPKVELSDLSELEHNAYEAWWRDLDPFHIGRADNGSIFKFVSGCGLPDHILEEILGLFQEQKEGLTREQFFAILRLIAHAQNGRLVNRDILYLGAPLPRFQTQAIDAVIKRSQPVEIDPARNSMDSVSSHSYNSNIHSAASSYNSTHTSNTNYNNTNTMPSWMLPSNKVTGAKSSIMSNATLLTPTRPYTPSRVSHSRSRSVPYNFLSTLDDSASDKSPVVVEKAEKSTHRRSNHSSHVSMDADSLQKIMDTTGSSMLLTQSFKPDFLLEDEEENNNSSSNNISNSGSIRHKSYNPYINVTNPFETDDSSSTTPTQTPTILPQTPPHSKSSLSHQITNSYANSAQMPPPPVPPQSTKPAYPKYARRVLI